MSMDIGDWSLLGTAPGFVKKYCAGCRRILKRQQSKRNRQQAKQQLQDEDQPATRHISHSTSEYASWTRARN